MIYFATFILTLLLSHIARAVPACGDDASPKDLYDPVYDDIQQPFVVNYEVRWDPKYDHNQGNTKTLTCSNLAHKYPHFKDLPHFPNIGAAFDVKHRPAHCGKCWKLRNKKTNESISLSAVDHTDKGFKISKKAFEKLNGHKPGKKLEVEAREVPASVCGFT